ncbi:unnamed protein product [Ectocarpus sp. CCAP 1310/34]|nr:unnamed protein product [Ectocarpus sp. CCAP 1310/34]
MTLLELISGVAGEEDLCMLVCVCCLYEWRRYHELHAPTTLEGVFPNLNFFEAIGGFDFKEVFRFEKPHLFLAASTKAGASGQLRSFELSMWHEESQHSTNGRHVLREGRG